MAGITTALVVGALAAGAGAYGANQQKKTADAAMKDARSGRASADQILADAMGRSLELPVFNAVDNVGEYSPELLDIYGQLQGAGQQAQMQSIFDSIGGVIGDSFQNDLSISSSLLDQVFSFSREQQQMNAELLDESFEQQGIAGARRNAMSGLESFLNFELPDQARQEIQRATMETGYATGTVGSSLQPHLAGQLTAQQLTQNFFQALPQLQQMTAQNQSLYQPGLDTSRLPQPGTTLQLELSNLEQRNQAGLLNYQNKLNQEIQRYQNDLSATLANFQRKDEFDMLRANIQSDRANANTATANAANAAANQSLMAGFQTAGTLVGMSLGNRPQQQTALQPGGRPAGS